MILRALGAVYGAAAARRRRGYAADPARRRRLDRPVVSVGNLRVGGTGKTPIVAHVVRLLAERGERPGVLSRGYARTAPADGVTVVSDRTGVLAGVAAAGDEPLMLAERLPGVPVLVAESRYLAGRLAERRFDVTVHVLDDGFQHHELARDLDLLVIGEEDLIDRPLPAGRLREPVSAAAAADAVLVPGGDEAAAERVGRTLGVPAAFRVLGSLGRPRTIRGGEPVVVPPGARVFAVAGIAGPDRFFADLRAAGWEIVGNLTFRDHHPVLDRGRRADGRRREVVRRRHHPDHRQGRDAAGVSRARRAPAGGRSADDHNRARGRLPPAAGPRGAGDRRRASPVRHRLEYLAVRAVIAVVAVMPGPLVRGCGSLLGLAFYVVDGAHRRIAQRNLAAAFPVRSARERRGIVRGVFTHFGRLLLELLKFSTLSPEAMLARVEFDGEERARLAYAQGKGVLFVTGHFGFWELHAIVHALRLHPIGVLARALDNPYLNGRLEAIRCRTGNVVIYRQGTIRRVMRMLQAGEGVAVLIDQHIQSRDAIYVDFFNRPAATTSAVAALALRTGAPVVPVFAVPLGGGRYRMIYEHPVEPPRAESEDAVREFTQRCTDVLEMYVRRHPELWLWMHRRWRDNGPSSDRVPGMFPSAEHEAEEL